jgi:hypothetical protein
MEFKQTDIMQFLAGGKDVCQWDVLIQQLPNRQVSLTYLISRNLIGTMEAAFEGKKVPDFTFSGNGQGIWDSKVPIMVGWKGYPWLDPNKKTLYLQGMFWTGEEGNAQQFQTAILFQRQEGNKLQGTDETGTNYIFSYIW